MRFLKRLKNNKIRDAQGVLAAIPTDLFKVFYFILTSVLKQYACGLDKKTITFISAYNKSHRAKVASCFSDPANIFSGFGQALE